jgi:GNAT superfamily N-acetyltransferase
MPVAVHVITDLPPDIEGLRKAAEDEGHNLVDRLVDEWQDGSNRFDRPGEVLAEVRCDDALCAVGGLNIDPYIDDPTVGRIRHVFVHPDARRIGIGRELVGFLVESGRGHFDRVRLRSTSDPGPAFYPAIGFMPTYEPDATHEVVFRPHTAAE